MAGFSAEKRDDRRGDRHLRSRFSDDFHCPHQRKDEHEIRVELCPNTPGRESDAVSAASSMCSRRTLSSGDILRLRLLHDSISEVTGKLGRRSEVNFDVRREDETALLPWRQDRAASESRQARTSGVRRARSSRWIVYMRSNLSKALLRLLQVRRTSP